MPLQPYARTFKTAWFAKAASKAKITDAALCRAIGEVMQGQADDLGGGVFKKRLNDNRHRSIILAKGGQHWVYAFLFAKSDQANIASNELEDFKKLASAYARMTAAELNIATHNKDLLEICHDD
jgi:hypothetical protein